MSLLEIRGLRKRYGAVDALRGLSLDVEQGEFFGLLGPNGAGKSTTINILLGLILADGGAIRVFNEDLTANPTAIRRRMNVAAAFTSMSGVLTVRENLTVYGHIYRVQHLQQKIDELLEHFEITDLARRRLQHLSSGQHTRVTLCKGFLNDPELLLLDECTVGLDPDIAEKTRRALQAVQRERKTTVLFTSHNMQEVEMLCGRVAFLSEGQILRVDTADDMKRLIPQQVMEVTFRPEADLSAVISLNGLCRVEPRGNGVVRFVLDEPARQLDGLLRRLMQCRSPIVDIHVSHPTLEDVFIKVARGEL